MMPIDRFEIVEQRRAPSAHIVLRPRDGGGRVSIDAAALVAQYAVSDTDTLLVLDEDVPLEEQLHLVLVRGAAVLDHLVIGAPYATGVFRAADSAGDAPALRFRFESEAVWTLSVRAVPRRGIGGLPAGARRRGGLLAPHHLLLRHEDAA